ncbi:MAG: diacylglycerol kinase family lipid kinase [Ardenticatenaceae bacterium]|nr:diacylglycerol kinase family lipid kinase [Ardenticatenaceae bacterium]
MRQATLIYNPLAGPVNLAATIELVADFWRARGWRVFIRATQAAGHATQLAEEAAVSGHRLVLAAGGDGTLGEVANGLAGTAAVMAPLPVGTANSFARELCMPRPGILTNHQLLQAADALANGRVQQMDLGYTHDEGGNGRYWLLWAGTGTDGFLVNEVEPRPRWSKRLGPLGYTMQAAAALPHLPTMHATVEIDGQQISDAFTLIVASNCRLYAGGLVKLSPQAFLDDGLFEVWLFRGSGIGKTAQHLWHSLRGEHLHREDMILIHGRSIAIHSDPIMPCQTDGDKAGFTPLYCEIKPQALHILIPDTAPPDLFSQPGTPL